MKQVWTKMPISLWSAIYRVFWRGAFLLSLAVTGTAVEAAPDDCLKISEDLVRLSCYDPELGYAPVVKEVRGAGEWSVQTETSKMDDSTNVYMQLRSTEQTNCPYKPGKHTLTIACRENTTSLWIVFGRCFMSDNGGRGRVTYRIDSKPAATISMRESNDNSALGLWRGASAIPFLKKLFGGSKLLVQATPFSDSRVTAEYPIAGIEEAIKPLRAACHW